MKRAKRKPRLPEFAVQGLKALQEAVAEVYEQSSRTGIPVSIWRDGKVVQFVPGEKPRGGRAASAKRSGNGLNGNNRSTKK